jgi:futalosine hydrolase
VVDLLVCAATELESHLLKNHAQVLLTGIGSVNAAYTLTRFLDRNEVKRIVICGIGGAYLGSGLSIGDVCCAATETYGDLGVETPDGFLDIEAMGFPFVSTFPLQIFPHQRREKFVTVNTCSGTDTLARKMEKRTAGGSVENMEGAALAHVAGLAGIPLGEIRGISNMTGNRDRAAWRVREASTAAQEALIKWIKTL